MSIWDAATAAAKICAEICDRNGDTLSANMIKEYFHILPKQQTCALLVPKDNHDPNHNSSD